MKKCKHCGITKPLDEFYRDNAGQDGRRPECKECTSARRKAWYRANRDREISRVRAWQQENKDQYNERQRRYREMHPDRDWSGYLKRKFGMTVDEYDAFLVAHGGRCAICGHEPAEGTRLHLDHDHESKAVRGMLCVRCNNGLGQFQEDPALLERAVDYLQVEGFVPGGVAELENSVRARAFALKAGKAS